MHASQDKLGVNKAINFGRRKDVERGCPKQMLPVLYKTGSGPHVSRWCHSPQRSAAGGDSSRGGCAHDSQRPCLTRSRQGGKPRPGAHKDGAAAAGREKG